MLLAYLKKIVRLGAINNRATFLDLESKFILSILSLEKGIPLKIYINLNGLLLTVQPVTVL